MLHVPDMPPASRPMDPERLSASAMAATLSRALEHGVEGSADDAVVFYDLAFLETRLRSLAAAFPPSTLHAVAVKANPSVEILKRTRAAGHGAEVASIGELELALAAGFPIESLVFDSPVKTREELDRALRLGIWINANTLDELGRIADLHASLHSASRVGIRVNPELGKGAIEATSVAVQGSKFGVPLGRSRAAILEAFSRHPCLTGIHVHIGSQGMSRSQLLEDVGAAYDLFVEANRSAGATVFNIGGGLPAKYRDQDTPPPFEDYATALRGRCPRLFEPGVALVTEFGRSLHANCGWVASKIEYAVDNGNDLPTLLVHVGADMFVRKAYRPDDWHHDLSVCDPSGRLRVGPKKPFRVAGPLCFAGDFLDRNVALPADVREGDYLLIHDAGAYTFSMWSIYNSRQFPAIIGYEGEEPTFKCLRRRQSVDEIVDFWSRAS